MTERAHRTSHEGRVFLQALLCGAPGAAVAFWFLWSGATASKSAWALTLLVLGAWVGGSFVVRESVARPLQTISNLLAALREGDLSIRGRGARRGDTLGEVLLEINLLGDTLARQRSGALEATALLGKVMSEIDVAIFAFDDRRTLRLINRAGERLLGKVGAELVG